MHMMKQRRLGLFDPGCSILDGEGLAPVFDLDFTQGRPYAHRIINKTAATATRASSANRYWLQPADDVGTNVLRYAQNSAINGLNGLLIEGADQNVIIRNTFAAYQAGDWTATVGTSHGAIASPDIYNGGTIYCAAGLGVGYFYQTVALTAVKYIVEVLVYKDGTAVSAADIQVAAGASGAIAALASTYEHLGGGVYLVWAVFTATAANWDVGVKNNLLGQVHYTSLLSCYIAAPTNEGGDFPRSPIPNAGAAAITRAADVYTHPADNNVGLVSGMVDVEFVAPCTEVEAAANLRIFICEAGGEYIVAGYEATANTLWCRHKAAGVNRDASAALAGLARGQTVQIRMVYGDSGAKKVILYANRGAGWTELGSNNNALGGNLPAGMTLYIGLNTNGLGHLGSFIRRFRVYSYAIAGVPAW